MGKGSWRGIWEMFAALVFYDLVTTMVMIMWKDGEVLAVQCVSALVAGAVFLARQHRTQDQIRTYLRPYYPLDFRLEEIRDSYQGDATCSGSVPQALESFLEAKDFEDTIRNAVSLGGDTDTLAAIAGSIAEPFFGIPEQILEEGRKFYLPEMIQAVK